MLRNITHYLKICKVKLIVLDENCEKNEVVLKNEMHIRFSWFVLVYLL